MFAVQKPLCIEGCPVEINIPAFIKYISEGDYIGAAIEIKKQIICLQFVEEYVLRKINVRKCVYLVKIRACEYWCIRKICS